MLFAKNFDYSSSWLCKKKWGLRSKYIKDCLALLFEMVNRTNKLSHCQVGLEFTYHFWSRPKPDRVWYALVGLSTGVFVFRSEIWFHQLDTRAAPSWVLWVHPLGFPHRKQLEWSSFRNIYGVPFYFWSRLWSSPHALSVGHSRNE